MMPATIDEINAQTIAVDHSGFHNGAMHRATMFVLLVFGLILAADDRPGNAAILDLTTDGSIQLSQFPTPPICTAGEANDFTLTLWFRRDVAVDGQMTSVLDGDAGRLTIVIDDAADVLRFSFAGSQNTITTTLALHDASGVVPVGEWMLLACSWDSVGRSLTAFAQSETAGLVASSGADLTSEFDCPLPLTLGSANGLSAAIGQYGLLVLRTHQMIVSDFELLWNGGAPHYFAPMNMQAGSFDGPDGVAFTVGHGVSTSINGIINLNAISSELGDAVNPDNVLTYVDFGLVDYYTVGNLIDVTGDWTFRSPHESGAAHAGFFVRELPDLGLGKTPWTQRVSPLTKQLADGTPKGLIRTITSANSRAVRVAFSYDNGWENYTFGGLYRARMSQVAGVTIPAWIRQTTPWPGFRNSTRLEGTINITTDTALPSVAFGNFGTHGVTNQLFPSYLLQGIALVAEDGSAFTPKARPEAGTLFDSVTNPLTVRVMLLSFPGAGMVTYQGEKATSQPVAGTLVGDPTTIVLDSTVYTQMVSAGDIVDQGALTLTLDGTLSDIAVGHGCAVAGGTGAGGITMVTEIDTSNGVSTTITLEQWFAVSPAEGSELAFGPVTPVWIEHAWPGLDADDPEVYRGIRVEPTGGIAVALFYECFRPDADGLIIGAVGRSATGYTSQIDRLFTAGPIPMFVGLQADVWLQFFANQGSEPSSMAAYSDLLLASNPATEVWWCGDVDMDTLIDNDKGTDDWQGYLLANAEAHGVGAVTAHEHPAIGTGSERAADGQVAGRSHLSARGNEIFVEATLELLQTAALAAKVVCIGDCAGAGDDVVDTVDLLALLAGWGAASECDISGEGGFADGVTDIMDLLALLANWGPCTRP